MFLGGCAGGAIRYAVSSVGPTSLRFPWPVLGVNLAGAFVLCLAVVVSESLTSARRLRLFIGIGLCGSLTTMSSVVDFADFAFGHGRAEEAVLYLAATVFGGLVVGSFGLVVGRAILATRRRSIKERRER